MKPHFFLTFLLVCLLAACGPSQGSIDTVSDQAVATAAVATAAVSVQQTVMAGMPTPPPAPAITDAPAQPPAAVAAPFTGIWINAGGDVLVLTDELLYYRFAKNDALYEHFGEVQGYDPQKGEIDFFLQRIRVNGQDAGFDSPQNKARFAIHQDVLTFEVLVDPNDASQGVRLSGEFTRGFQDRFPDRFPAQ